MPFSLERRVLCLPRTVGLLRSAKRRHILGQGQENVNVRRSPTGRANVGSSRAAPMSLLKCTNFTHGSHCMVRLEIGVDGRFWTELLFRVAKNEAALVLQGAETSLVKLECWTHGVARPLSCQGSPAIHDRPSLRLTPVGQSSRQSFLVFGFKPFRGRKA
jgi:hypothetical protein